MSYLRSYSRAHDISGQSLSTTPQYRQPDERWTCAFKFTSPHAVVDQGFLSMSKHYVPSHYLVPSGARWTIADRHAAQHEYERAVSHPIDNTQVERLFRDENVVKARYLPEVMTWIGRLACAQPYVLLTLEHLRSPTVEDFADTVAVDQGLRILLEANCRSGGKRSADDMMLSGDRSPHSSSMSNTNDRDDRATAVERRRRRQQR